MAQVDSLLSGLQRGIFRLSVARPAYAMMIGYWLGTQRHTEHKVRRILKHKSVVRMIQPNEGMTPTKAKAQLTQTIVVSLLRARPIVEHISKHEQKCAGRDIEYLHAMCVTARYLKSEDSQILACTITTASTDEAERTAVLEWYHDKHTFRTHTAYTPIVIVTIL